MRLASSVDDLVRAGTGVPVHVRSAVDRESEGKVGKAFLDRHDALDAVARAAEHVADVVEDLRVDVHQEILVELLKIGKGIEFVDDARSVAA